MHDFVNDPTFTIEKFFSPQTLHSQSQYHSEAMANRSC